MNILNSLSDIEEQALSHPLSVEDSRWQPLRIDDRLIRNRHWSTPISHRQLSLIGCTLESVVWTELTLTSGLLSRARLRGCTFKRAIFRDTTFNDCELEDVTFEACTFNKCIFQGGSQSRIQLKSCQIADCQFSGLTLRNLTLLRGVVCQTHIKKTHLQQVKCSSLQLDHIAMKKCQLNAVDLTLGQLVGFSSVGGSVQQLTLQDIALESITAEGLERLDNATLAGVTARDLVLTHCASVSSLILTGVSCDRLVLEGCSDVVLMTVYGSQIADFQLIQTRMRSSSNENSTMTGTTRIADACLDGVMFLGGRWDDLHVSGVELLSLQRLHGVHFERLELKDVVAASDLEVDQRDVSYGSTAMQWER